MNIKRITLDRLAIAFTALLALSPAPLRAAGTTYYVAIDGDDSNDGRSLKTPLKRIQKAAEIMQAGDTCLIRGGEYREKVVPPRGGTSEQARITYRNYGDEKPVIKGSERVTTWVDQGGGVWKAQLPPAFFASSPYNPFATKVSGSCIVNPGNQWSLGMVYLNGEPLRERLSLAEVQSTPKTWWASREKEITSVYARFEVDPNKAVTEVNVRDSCFHPGDRVLSFLSIIGLTMRQAAPNGSGNAHPQQGIITVFAGRGWLIEGCALSDSACSGIALATGPETWYGPTSATQDAKGTEPDFNASGFHAVRHNTIERCGQAGIIGMINGHSSLIDGNLIQDINVERKIGGAETAGIKLHWAIDTLIRHNIIRRVYNAKEAGQNFGLWLDFCNQGSRVTGNVIYDIIDPARSTPKCFPLYLEANVGPIVVDNNILIHDAKGPYNNELGSLHQLAAHNLVVEGRLQHFNDPSRNVPYYQQHSLKYIARLDAGNAQKQDHWRYINRNNVYVGQWSGHDGATVTGGNVQFDWNGQQALKFNHTDTSDGMTIEFWLSDEAHAKLTGGDLVTSASLGEFPLVRQRLEDREGKPYDLDTDIAGQTREPKAGTVVPGPFAKLAKGRNAFRFTAGSTSSAFVSSERK
jgi:alpha-N-arabinofuranosidase